MKVKAVVVDSEGRMEIKVVDHFDVFAFQEFREAYRSAPDTVKDYDIDLSLMEGFTSAAFGSLLVMCDEVDGDSNICITECNDPEFLALLHIAKLDEKLAVTV